MIFKTMTTIVNNLFNIYIKDVSIKNILILNGYILILHNYSQIIQLHVLIYTIIIL
jgi:hypothetical protein